MADMINFGIDLGTTNSLIAKFVKGDVEVFKNPTTLTETFSSAIAFKKERIIVGNKAREFLEKEPQNVVSNFKRLMGTTETKRIELLNKSFSPIELSSFILKELKRLIHTGEMPESVVITVPASFDLPQKNATKEAGLLAGYKQVVLLSEPIAASLAYTYKKKEKNLEDGKWLVYDLGGGTFDVALVNIKSGELNIIDHEGDNFLGGKDIDELIVRKIIIPKLKDNGNFSDLEYDMTENNRKYNSHWYTALIKAEIAKIELSVTTSALIDMSIKDENDKEIDIEFQITRTELEKLIESLIEKTSKFIQIILTRNSLLSSDLKFVLMVGGSTYIPLVRKRIEELLQIPVITEINPTNAIVVGAAYYAGTIEKEIETSETSKKNYKIKIRMAYQKFTQEKEELFAARVDGNIDGLFYRIVREDGGFDSGLKNLTNKINEDLLLVEQSYNSFKFLVYDEFNNKIDVDNESFSITHGLQPPPHGSILPKDISIELDDIEKERTILKQIFLKNSPLPIRKTITVSTTRVIPKGSLEDAIHIDIYEGPSDASPESNLRIGHLKIDGTQINRDLIKGADVEITLDFSHEEMMASAYIQILDQEFSAPIYSDPKKVIVSDLHDNVENLILRVDKEIEDAKITEEWEIVKQLEIQRGNINNIYDELLEIPENDITDRKFKIEAEKRKVSCEIDKLTKGKKLSMLKKMYLEEKENCMNVLADNGNDHDTKRFNEIIDNENQILNSNNLNRLKDKVDELVKLRFTILWRTPSFLLYVFNDIKQQPQILNDPVQAKSLIDSGKIAIENEDWDKLVIIDDRLISLLPTTDQNKFKFIGKGIG